MPCEIEMRRPKKCKAASDIPKYTNTNPLFQFSAVVAIDV